MSDASLAQSSFAIIFLWYSIFYLLRLGFEVYGECVQGRVTVISIMFNLPLYSELLENEKGNLN